MTSTFIALELKLIISLNQSHIEKIKHQQYSGQAKKTHILCQLANIINNSKIRVD